MQWLNAMTQLSVRIQSIDICMTSWISGKFTVKWSSNYHLWPQRQMPCKSNTCSLRETWAKGLYGHRVARVSFYPALHHWSQSCSLEACLLLLLRAHFPSPSPVPSGVPSNQRSFDGEAVQGEAQGIMTETAGALVTASMFSKPATTAIWEFSTESQKKIWEDVITEKCTQYIRAL